MKHYITPDKKFKQPKQMSDYENGLWLGIFIGGGLVWLLLIILSLN